MENKCHGKNIFESGFDSFELDDEFFNRLDLDLKKNNANEKLSVSKRKTNDGKREKDKKRLEIKTQCYDSLFIDDSNDSDFFEFRCKEKKQSLKVGNDSDKKRNNRLCNNGFISYLSPIQGEKLSKSVNKRLNLSSSTPERKSNESDSKGKAKPRENSVKNSDFDSLEAALFEDWDIDECKKEETEKETVTLSQALRLLEEAESERRSDQESLNDSIDLLTGEIINANIGGMFEESFGLPKSMKKTIVEESSDESVIIKAIKTVSKPPAAQKLNFESEKINCEKAGDDKENLKDFCFSSDEDFAFCSQDILNKTKQVTKRAKQNTEKPKFTKSAIASPVKDSDLNESSDIINTTFQKKRRKCPKVIESDTAEDSPSPKFLRQNKMISKKRKNPGFQCRAMGAGSTTTSACSSALEQGNDWKLYHLKEHVNQQGHAKLQLYKLENIGREYIHLEAEMSDSFEVSSDEVEESGEFDQSFVDESSYLTQNCAANMTAKYLESVKSVNRLGTFKIPAPKPYSPTNVFSQIPEESNSDYEIDSFCIKDVEEEEEEKSDLSDLEIAEKILEMDRKKRKKKRNQKLRKL